MFAINIRNLSNKIFDYLVVTRQFHQKVDVAVRNQFTAIQIDVPWGKIDGKLWGSGDKQPILAIHGWMDNAGSFDMLAPLLKNSTILAIDLPGHGLSSWLPPGIPYNEDIYVETIRLIVKHFSWNKVKFLGHSMGGIFAYNYARLFPEETEFVISIDSLTFIPTTIEKYTKTKGQSIDKYIEYDKKYLSDPPSYPEEKAIQKWMNATAFKSLDIPATKILMIRGAKKKEDGTYFYTRDLRLSTNIQTSYTLENIQEMSCFISCPYFVVKASSSTLDKLDANNKYWSQIVESVRNSAKDFQLVKVQGNHHIHMINPKEVANCMIPFLEKYDP